MEDARRVVVLTGAGVSAESGIPTFRGEAGLWKSHRPEELATPQAFRRDPRLVWEWYAWRRTLVARCEPNQAHRALARFALADASRTTLVTQNVDGLHHQAARAEAGETTAPNDGTTLGLAESAYPLEVHGAIHRDRCSSCGRLDEAPGRVDAESADRLPTCGCGALMRPDVVWFGEALDPDVIGASMAAADEADVCLVIGTSAVVHPAASIPEVTRRRGGRVVEVNLEPTPVTGYADVTLLGTAGSLVPALLA
ncbi:MAG: NAD-dependent deacylase [Gemmatimonadetes bacterium]|nr:NAD-dependent deacylase [Gemmatimonadota bacterium]